MSRFVDNSEVKEIQAPWWDEDEHVIIRKFSYGDRQAFTRTMMRGMRVQPKKKAKAVDEDPEGRLLETDIGSMNLVILERGIKSWTLKDNQGRVAVLSRRTIERLRPEDGDFILEEINEYNPSDEDEEDEEASFRAGGGSRDGIEE